MKREKDKILKSFFIKVLSENFYKIRKKPSSIMIALFLSFSLHLFIVFLISILSSGQQNIIETRKIDIKPIEINLASNIFLNNPDSSDLSSLKLKNEKRLKENKFNNLQNIITKSDQNHNNEFKERTEDNQFDKSNSLSQNQKENQDEIIDEKSENNGSNEIDQNSSNDINFDKNSDLNGSSKEYVEYEEGNSSGNDSPFSSENILSYSINYTSLFKYPKDALKLGLQGIVKIKVQIDTEGKVVQVLLLESSGSKILDNYTIKQASQLLFTFPKDKRPNSTFWVTIKVIYSIKSMVTVQTGD